MNENYAILPPDNEHVFSDCKANKDVRFYDKIRDSFWENKLILGEYLLPHTLDTRHSPVSATSEAKLVRVQVT